VTEAFEIIGAPEKNGILIVVDHASNHVPSDINLGIPMEFLNDHIAYDIGVANIAKFMSDHPGHLAIMGAVSRLVVDLNRYPEEEAAIPLRSDAVEILGNVLNADQRKGRLDQYFTPYHNRVAELIRDLEPLLVLSLHSFTPTLRSNRSVDRPWDIGVLYNEYETASRLALQFLGDEDLLVGDQLPYSGKDLNATMNRQAEAINQPYFGIEIRQDLVAHETGQRRFADILTRTCKKIRSALA